MQHSQGTNSQEHARRSTIRSSAERLALLRTQSLRLAVDDRPHVALSPRAARVLEQGPASAEVIVSLTPDRDAQLLNTAGARCPPTRNACVLADHAARTRPDAQGLARAEPAWTFTSIEIAPRHGLQAEPGTNLPLRVVVAVQSLAVYLEEDQR